MSSIVLTLYNIIGQKKNESILCKLAAITLVPLINSNDKLKRFLVNGKQYTSTVMINKNLIGYQTSVIGYVVQ